MCVTSQSIENHYFIHHQANHTRSRFPDTDSSIVTDTIKHVNVDASRGVGFWGLEQPPSTLTDDRSISEYCNGLFGAFGNDKENAALVDEFGDLFGETPVIEKVEEESTFVYKPPVITGRFTVPTIPTLINHQNNPTIITNSIATNDRSENRIKTHKEMKQHYRKHVAIPRYLKKRQNRKWDKELMHPSRSVAAQRRPRVGGQFGIVDARFTPCTQQTSV